jgi:hypothetical protein
MTISFLSRRCSHRAPLQLAALDEGIDELHDLAALFGLSTRIRE